MSSPPLFDMNPMSALYHIPQNPAPTLPESCPCGEGLRQFMACCLVKDPKDRMDATSLAKVSGSSVSIEGLAKPPGRAVLAGT